MQTGDGGQWDYQWGKQAASLAEETNPKKVQIWREADEFGVINVELEPHVSNAVLDALVISKLKHRHILYQEETPSLIRKLIPVFKLP